METYGKWNVLLKSELIIQFMDCCEEKYDKSKISNGC